MYAELVQDLIRSKQEVPLDEPQDSFGSADSGEPIPF